MKDIFKILLFSMLFITCTKDDIALETDVIVVNNKIRKNKKTEASSRLSFESREAFKEFIRHRVASKIDVLEEAKALFEKEGRVSLLLVYTSLDKEVAERLGLKKENIAVVDSPDSMLLYILNEKGEVQIENKIFRIDGEFVYSYTTGFSGSINKFKIAYAEGGIKIEPGATISFGKNLTVYKHTNIKGKEKIQGKSSKREIIEFNGRKTRMIAKQWNGYWAFYSSIGSVTKTQEWAEGLFWGEWKDVKTDNRLEFSASWSTLDFFEILPSTKSKSSYNYCNCYEAIDVYDWSTDVIPVKFNPVNGVTKHWSHWYSAIPNKVSTWIYY